MTSFTNGDQLRGQWSHPILVVDTSFGRLRIPTGQIIQIQQRNAPTLTNMNGLDLQGVTEVRIRASGGHWIGLYELEIWGTP